MQGATSETSPRYFVEFDVIHCDQVKFYDLSYGILVATMHSDEASQRKPVFYGVTIHSVEKISQ
jgi:hypothetical protein